jgi:biotin operon repressor
MLYRRSQAIEKRLHNLLELVRRGRHSTPTLARALDISQPTVSRCLTALRERGYSIRAVKDKGGWWYELAAEPATGSHGRDGVR